MKIIVKKLQTHLQKTKGLIGVKKVNPVYFETRFGIHTFGMLKPIDVLIMDNDFRVVKTYQNLKPGNLFFWPIKYKKVLELPAGFTKKYKIKLKDKLSLKMVK